jgi:hypothetical protein
VFITVLRRQLIATIADRLGRRVRTRPARASGVGLPPPITSAAAPQARTERRDDRLWSLCCWSSVLVGWIKYDMQRTAAPQPATGTGMNSAPIRGAQLTRLSGCTAPITPTLTVVDLLGRVARFQLAQRVVDRGEGYRDAVVL